MHVCLLRLAWISKHRCFVIHRVSCALIHKGVSLFVCSHAFLDIMLLHNSLFFFFLLPPSPPCSADGQRGGPDYQDSSFC